MKYSKGDQFIYATFGGTWFVGEVTAIARVDQALHYKILISDSKTIAKQSVMAVGSSVYNGAQTSAGIDKGEYVEFMFDVMRREK